MDERRKTLALEIKELIEELSPIIESFTSEVCPTCRSVCCKHKHSLYDEEDKVFLRALSVEPVNDESLDPDGPCQFLSPTGCVRPRWKRPFRCTWYFCEALLEYMPEASGRHYRRLVRLLNEILEKRKALIDSSL
ncbi:MAG: hypothetical protein GXO99_02350 [Nitrospirae bacterium]|nr:hypothetical protein [Nitrospirota bacterium]